MSTVSDPVSEVNIQFYVGGPLTSKLTVVYVAATVYWKCHGET